jgi:hypothetical protein
MRAQARHAERLQLVPQCTDRPFASGVEQQAHCQRHVITPLVVSAEPNYECSPTPSEQYRSGDVDVAVSRQTPATISDTVVILDLLPSGDAKSKIIANRSGPRLGKPGVVDRLSFSGSR